MHSEPQFSQLSTNTGVVQLDKITHIKDLTEPDSWKTPKKWNFSPFSSVFKILEGSPDPNSPGQLTKEAKEELALVEKRIQQSFSTRLDYDLEKAVAPHSSTLAWKIPWTEEPVRLQSMGSLRVGHDK